MKKLKESSFVSLIAVFAAFNIVCDSLMGPPLPSSGVWYSWIFMSESINGIILGPYAGFFSSFIGVMVGHSIYFRGSPEFLFTLGAPIGAMISSLIFRGKWKIALIYYLALLGAFFITPVSWQLPFWGMWDVYLAFGCLLFLIVVMKKWKSFWDTKSTGVRLLHIVALCTFIGLEADVLFRIFILVPCQTYQIIYALDVSELQLWWAIGAVETSTKAALSTLVTMMVASPIIKAVRKMGLGLVED
ncbi:MAG: hypothetical protein OEY95_04825 [Candidatus Bathyarchaeota archaeon]|nr:hypothetical protein [Candidatus Bathyarchaeota archaeon]MDH5754508.1 hypothetical protein [Candidatus Bathyarchaeota archaeon]